MRVQNSCGGNRKSVEAGGYPLYGGCKMSAGAAVLMVIFASVMVFVFLIFLIVASPQSEDELTPGLCECRHERSVHRHGKEECRVEYPQDAEWPNGAVCACQIYIFDACAEPEDIERALGVQDSTLTEPTSKKPSVKGEA
jgi:hypothetical protein